MAYPGIYRAKALRLDDTRLLTANIPQVFGEAPVTITSFVGEPPATSEMGWVAFHGGRPEYPVWLGVGISGAGGGGTVTDTLWVGADAPEDDDIELWYDTDEPAPVSVVVTGSRAGNAALASLLTVLQNLGLITNSTTV